MEGRPAESATAPIQPRGIPLWAYRSPRSTPSPTARFAGNPAAVCVLSEPAEDAWMQDVARRDEPLGDGVRPANRLGHEVQPALVHSPEGSRSLRPCHARDGPRPLGRRPLPRSEPALFETRSGLLTARRGPDGIELDFPAEPVTEEVKDPDELAELRAAPDAPFRFAGAIGSTSWSSSTPRTPCAAYARTSAGSSNFRSEA